MSTTSNKELDPTASSFEIRDHLKSVNPKADVIGANHNSPAPTFTAEPEFQDASTKDDPATTAASEELKHTSISDKVPIPADSISKKDPEQDSLGADKEMSGTDKDTTPEAEPADAQDEEMKDRVASPKKKRGRDQEDDAHLSEDESARNSGSAGEGNNINGSRTMRSGPEKKRPRDTSQGPSRIADKELLAKEISTTKPVEATESTKNRSKLSPEPPSTSTFGKNTSDKPATSGFGSLAAASSSPFGALGASKPSIFGGNTQSVSGFGALAASKTPSSTTPTSTLGGSSGKTTSGFGSTFGGGFGALGSGSVFGSALGNGFAGGSGPKLSSFAAPGKESVTAGKPAKPFGAPDSDEDEDDDEDDSEGGADADDEEGDKTAVDDKKKSKATKVHIDDGEAEEATLLQIRAKLFALGSKEVGWKERGVGTLKINAPSSCVDIDDLGHSIPGSFDSSMLEDRPVRLIMRQENTHRVILNTVILKAMEFKPKPSTTSAQIVFNAFEGGDKPTSMLLKMSEANYKLFTNEIDSIQHEL